MTGPGGGDGGDGGVWDAGRIDTPPRLIRRQAPVYPLMARRRGIQGTATARVLVGITGAVQEVIIESATPPEIFEETVMEALSRWQFSPGRHHGQAVAAWVRVPIRFQLR
jgi:protein TonB